MILFIISVIFVGCGASHQYIMVQNTSEEYGLFRLGSDENPEYKYSDYQKTEGTGFIVKQGDAFGYISGSGQELISIGKYAKLEALKQMIVAYTEDGDTHLYDEKGKSLYVKDEIVISELPIIRQEDAYILLSGEGDELLKTDKEIKFVSLVNTTKILIGYETDMEMYDTTTKETDTISLNGYYVHMDEDEEAGYLLYDKSAEDIAYITSELDIGFTLSKEVDTVFFDANKNIIAKKDDDIWMISEDGEKQQQINSYYQTKSTYVIKNSDYVYGPHLFYLDGEKTEVEGIQLDPLAAFSSHDIFPVFVREKGFQFYNFAGEPAIDTVYRRASGFDRNGRSIVSVDGKAFYLIDTDDKIKSEEYVKIEFIGRNFYAGYTTDNRYEILDKDGNVLIDTYFMGDMQLVTYDNQRFGIFEKSGKSFVYDMQTFDLLFSCEGSVEFNKEGYFVNDNKVYYDMKGEKIFSR